jgi:hypothetical protein
LSAKRETEKLWKVKMSRRNYERLAVLFALSFALAMLVPIFAVRAQDTGQTSPSQKPPADSSKAQDQGEQQPAAGAAITWANNYFHEIGSAGVLAGSPEGLHWGKFYIPSADAMGAVERLETTGVAGTDIESEALFSAMLVYDREFKTNRIAIQYRPRLAVANGQVQKDFSNQNVSLDMILYSRPRWNVRFGNNFQYYYTQQSLGALYLSVDAVSSSTVSNFFVDSSNRWMSNNAFVSVSYALSARTSITVTPSYIYSESGTTTTVSRGQSYGGSVSWSHQTSARQSVGIQYSAQEIHEGGSSASDATYQTIAGTLERQLAPTWLLKGAAGATRTTYSIGSDQIFAYGNFSLVKRFVRSAMALNYVRGDSFANGFISNQYTDRVDLTYQAQIGRRWNWAAGGGYLRQVQGGGFGAKYATGQLGYLMAPRAGIYATTNYVRKNQTGNSSGLFSGNSDIFSFGISWQPVKAAASR